MLKPFRQITLSVSLMVVTALLLAACGGAPTTAPGKPTSAPTKAPATSTTAPTQAAQATPAPTKAAQATATPVPEQPMATPAPGAQAVPLKNPNTIIEATIGEPESLDPAWAYDTASGEVIFNVYETLLFPKKDKVDEFVPLLATKWEVSPDGKTYTFTIRRGVKFHGGQELTPEDVAYSLWRGLIQDRAGGPQWIMLQPFFGLGVQNFADDVVAKQFNGDWTAAVDAVKQMITYDNQAGTVTLHLAQPYGPMLQILSGTWAAIVSKPWVIEQGGWNGESATAQKFHDPAAEQDELFKVMNGTGPYKLDRWAPGEEVDLARNDSYWLTAPLWDGGPSGPAAVERVVIKNVSEWGTRFATLQAGDADIAYVDNQYVAQVEPLVKETCDFQTGNCTPTNPNGRLRLYNGLPTVSATTVFFNQAVDTTGGNNLLGSGKLDGNGIPADFFSDIHIRRAFNDCFDWKTYIDQVWNGEAEQALGPVINGELGFDSNQAHYSFDLTKCAAEFKAAAVKSEDGKSLWDTGFYLQYVYNTGNDQRRTAGEILKDSLAKVNPKFHLEVVGEPWPVFLKDQTNSRLPLFMIGWLEDFHDPHDWVTPYLASGGTYGGTQHFEASLQAQLDDLIKKGVETSDAQARARIYQQLQNLTYENALNIFVVQPQTRQYMQDWISGWYYNPTYPGNPGNYFYALAKGAAPKA